MRHPVNISDLLIDSSLSIEEVRDSIVSSVLSKTSSKILPIAFTDAFMEKHNLSMLYCNIKYYTQFLDLGCSNTQRVWHILNNTNKYPSCNQCGKKLGNDSFINAAKGYRKYCSIQCSGKANNSHDYMTDETRRLRNINIKLNRTYLTVTKETRAKQSNSAKLDSVKSKKKITNLARYGVENPGVMGAYSSKAAEQYILDYIDFLAVDINQCLFYSKEYNKKEIYQMIYDYTEHKFVYVSYDLVVFDTVSDAINTNMKAISLVLEYNGPWHYTAEDINGPAAGKPETPYHTCKKTRYDSYVHDEMKIEYIKKFTDNVYVYWEKSKSLLHV